MGKLKVMKKSRLLITLPILGLAMALFEPPACAWEFSMDGTFTWLYEYRTQMGKAGFFGQFDQAQDDGNSGFGISGFAPYNFYLGGYHKAASASDTGVALPYAAAYGGQGTAIAGGESIVSGSDASWQVFSMSTNMQIRMNKAVRIRGNYFIGSWNAPNYSASPGVMVSSGALTNDSPGVQRSFSPGYWRTLWVTTQTPWGILVVGKRPVIWGTGLSYNGDDNRASIELSLVMPYGPFRITTSFVIAKRGYHSDDYGAASGWFNERPDKNNTSVIDMTIPNVTYRSGPVDAGFTLSWVFRHKGREGFIGTAANRVNSQFSSDTSQNYGGAYFKYNNGKFFLNAEYLFDRQVENKNYSATATPDDITAPRAYVSHDSGVVELGALCGPAKITAIGAWLTGDDYRGGSVNTGTLRMLKITSGLQPDMWSNTGLFRPYSYLMVYGYGMGSSFARDTGNGFVQDATFYGARLDYAVAANLNIFGSLAWAERFSKSGFLWGCLRPATNNENAGFLTVATTTAPGLGGAISRPTQPYSGQVVLNNFSPTGADRIPTIPDGALGYEIDAGFYWKLLEGVTARCNMGYWVPGKWFSYACADKGTPNWGIWGGALNGDAFRTKPGKWIDPVFGMEFKLEYNF
jgi:hypothetical protein